MAMGEYGESLCSILGRTHSCNGLFFIGASMPAHGYYANVPAEVYRDSELILSELRVYCEIEASGNSKNDMWWTSRAIAESLNLNIRIVQNAIRKLEYKGYIERFWVGNIRHIRVVSTDTRVVSTDTRVVSPDTRGVVSPDTSNEDIKKKTLKEDYKNNDDFLREFSALWDIYPKKSGKAYAKQTFVKKRAKLPAIETLLAAVSAYVAQKRQSSTEIQFYLDFSTWLNRRTWEDYEENTEKLCDECKSTIRAGRCVNCGKEY